MSINDDSTATTVRTGGIDPVLVTLTHVIYGLHTLSIAIGIVSSTLVITAFLFGIPSILAVILNYVKRGDVRDTWLDSHFRWQIRTFWIALALIVGISLVFGPLSLVLVGLPFLIGGYALTTLWVTYRVARGWLALRDSRPMPLD
jgi:uncharacterized membrane protein